MPSRTTLTARSLAVGVTMIGPSGVPVAAQYTQGDVPVEFSAPARVKPAGDGQGVEVDDYAGAAIPLTMVTRIIP
jgi:hypothetical protein